MSKNTTDLLRTFFYYDPDELGEDAFKPLGDDEVAEVEQLISNREKLLLDRVEKEVIGDDIPSDFDHDAGFCQNCDFQPTDGTENCICKIVNMARFKQRQKLTTLRKELDGGRDE